MKKVQDYMIIKLTSAELGTVYLDFSEGDRIKLLDSDKNYFGYLYAPDRAEVLEKEIERYFEFTRKNETDYNNLIDFISPYADSQFQIEDNPQQLQQYVNRFKHFYTIQDE